MTLFSALRALPDLEVVGLNFSSATTPELLLKTFDHYCEYRKTPNGVVLSPILVRANGSRGEARGRGRERTRHLAGIEDTSGRESGRKERETRQPRGW